MDYCNLAGMSLQHWLETGLKYDCQERVGRRAGCFVTLTQASGDLRGCIGTIEPVCDDLALEIVDNAVSAGVRDPRFPPVTALELSGLYVEVSVLSPPQAVTSLDELDPRRYGVIVTQGFRRGVLLPDLEGVDTIARQLAITRRKAHIQNDDPVEISRFEVIKHAEPRR